MCLRTSKVYYLHRFTFTENKKFMESTNKEHIKEIKKKYLKKTDFTSLIVALQYDIKKIQRFEKQLFRC